MHSIELEIKITRSVHTAKHRLRFYDSHFEPYQPSHYRPLTNSAILKARSSRSFEENSFAAIFKSRVALSIYLDTFCIGTKYLIVNYCRCFDT